ncbi:UNVERIFIED_CONTAM: hypothetical protein FKN15_013587 [Acipenser sinensis]
MVLDSRPDPVVLNAQEGGARTSTAQACTSRMTTKCHLCGEWGALCNQLPPPTRGTSAVPIPTSKERVPAGPASTTHSREGRPAVPIYASRGSMPAGPPTAVRRGGAPAAFAAGRGGSPAAFAAWRRGAGAASAFTLITRRAGAASASITPTRGRGAGAASPFTTGGTRTGCWRFSTATA